MSKSAGQCILVTIASVLSVLVILLKESDQLALLCCWPAIYILIFPCLRHLLNKYHRYSISISIILALLWIRMVFLPFYGVLDGSYLKLQFPQDEIVLSVFLGAFESLCVCASVYIVCKSAHVRSIGAPTHNRLFLGGNARFYLFFFFFGIVIWWTVGRKLNLFDFIIKPVGRERVEELTDTRTLAIAQVISSALMFGYFCIINWAQKAYSTLQPVKNKKYVTFSVVMSLLLICIITGERRTSQIYKAFACTWLLLHIFSSYKKNIITNIGLVTLFVLLLMTIYKSFYAFMYDSYADAIAAKSGGGELSANVVDSYFYGIKTICMNIGFGTNANLTANNLLYDFGRNIFGLNYLIPRTGMTTSEIYNYQIYGGCQTTGYLLSNIGYGYLYMGLFFAPIFSIINVLLLLFLETRMRCANRIEWCYIWAFIFMRFAFGILGSIPPLINMCSRLLVINYIIYQISNLFVGSNNKKLKFRK